MPNLGFTICNLAFFPLGFRSVGPLSVGPPRQPPVATRGNSGLAYQKFRQFECALRTRYMQLLSGFVGTFGRCCWVSFIIVKDVL